MLWGFESVGLPLPLLFSCSSRIHRNHSAALIAVQPSFSTVRCKTLNIFIKVCYSLPCTPPPILACLPSKGSSPRNLRAPASLRENLLSLRQVHFHPLAPTPSSPICYRHTYTTDVSQLFWNQRVPHSFHRDGGVPPLFPFWNSSPFYLLSFLSIACGNPFCNPFLFNFIQEWGVGVPHPLESERSGDPRPVGTSKCLPSAAVLSSALLPALQPRKRAGNDRAHP